MKNNEKLKKNENACEPLINHSNPRPGTFHFRIVCEGRDSKLLIIT